MSRTPCAARRRPGTRTHASRGRARPKARSARAARSPTRPPPLGALSPRWRAAVRAHAPRTGSPSAASPPYAHCPSRRSTAGISAVIHRHPRTPRAAYKIRLLPLRAPPRAPPRHCRRRTELEISARARRRPTTLVAPLDTRQPPQLAYCPTHCFLAVFPRAAAATAAGRCRNPSPAASPPQRRPPTVPR
jgi:hypothetical protein